jgi:hypothetical protein
VQALAITFDTMAAPRDRVVSQTAECSVDSFLAFAELSHSFLWKLKESKHQAH